MNARLILLALTCMAGTRLLAQQSLESAYRTTGSAVCMAFEAQRAVLQKSSAVILDGRKEAGYGVVISADGHILTKASEFAALQSPRVTVDTQSFDQVTVVATDPVWDVALLKVPASGLQPVIYADHSKLEPGTWVVANGATSRSSRRLLPGIISAKSRELPPSGGAALGVVLKPNAKLLVIDQVNDPSGAKDAGMQAGDTITAVDGQPVSHIAELAERLKDRQAGSRAKITYRRGKIQTTVDVRLAARGEMFIDPMNRNDQMSGDFSRRRSGFPRVLQHDILGTSKLVGGPLLDLNGQCVGMNIARANRAESFAIPVEDLKSLATRMLKEHDSQ